MMIDEVKRDSAFTNCSDEELEFALSVFQSLNSDKLKTYGSKVLAGSFQMHIDSELKMRAIEQGDLVGT